VPESRTLRFVLGDQLSRNISSLSDLDRMNTERLARIRTEARDYFRELS
jgi:hypothetical protein